MKYNIPARTLRDWMKRLNIKSVFTHHSQKDGRSLSADSSEYSLISGESNPGNPNEEEETNEEIVPEEEDVEKSPDSESKVYYISLFRNKRFVLNEMFQRNASKFAIFYA